MHGRPSGMDASRCEVPIGLLWRIVFFLHQSRQAGPYGLLFGCALLLLRCSRAVALWQAMAKQWRIPTAVSFRRMGTEWLAQALCDLPETQQMELMMTLWICWHVRNELTHDKPAPLMEASRRILLGYVDSLIGLQNSPNYDPVKGKQVVDSVQPRTPILHPPTSSRASARWMLPAIGWMKLNVDGSYCPCIGTAIVGMVLRDSSRAIIFSSCRVLRVCVDPLEAEHRHLLFVSNVFSYVCFRFQSTFSYMSIIVLISD